jgi:hypothetical protein
MSRVEIVSKVGSDGVLRLAVPLAESEAGRDVRVTVEPLPRPAMTQEEWRAFVLRTAGTWQGEFERPEQGEYEVRDRLA